MLRRWLTEEELGQVPSPFGNLVGWRLERIDYGEVKLTGSTCLPDQCSVELDESLDELKSRKFSKVRTQSLHTEAQLMCGTDWITLDKG